MINKNNDNEDSTVVNKEIKENQNLINKLDIEKSIKSLGIKIPKPKFFNENQNNIEVEECETSDLKRT